MAGNASEELPTGAPSEGVPFVESSFLFTERDFKEYFIAAQMWLSKGYVMIYLPFSLLFGVPVSIFIVTILIRFGAGYDRMMFGFFVVVAALPYIGLLLSAQDLHRHYRPNFRKMQRDIEIFFARMVSGRPLFIYGDKGSLFKEIKEIRQMARDMGMTNDDPYGGRQSRPLGVVLTSRLYDDRIVSGSDGEVVVGDFRRDIAEIIDSRRFLVVRNSKLVDAVFDKGSMGGADPREVKRFIKMKKRGRRVRLEEVVRNVRYEDRKEPHVEGS